MNAATEQLIEQRLKRDNDRTKAMENSRCINLLEEALKGADASDGLLARMSIVLDCMAEPGCRPNELERRIKLQESGAEPTATAETAETGSGDLEARQASHLQAALSKKPSAKNGVDLQDRIVDLLQSERSFVR